MHRNVGFSIHVSGTCIEAAKGDAPLVIDVRSEGFPMHVQFHMHTKSRFPMCVGPTCIERERLNLIHEARLMIHQIASDKVG